MDWVILAGTVGHEVSWTHGLPRPLLPLPTTTFLEELLSAFQRSPGSGTCTICANGHTNMYSRSVRRTDALGSRVGFVEDEVPRGPAGCIKACEGRLTGETIVVAGGAVWVEDELEWMLQQHRAQENALTVFCMCDPDACRPSKSTLLRSAGIYFCEPTVLNFIRTEGYQDLKEQLIPSLRQSGLRVGAITLQRGSCEVSDWSSYLKVLGRTLATGRFATEGYRELAPGIWAGDSVTISAGARIVGPVFLGHHCTIADGAVVVGPTLVGEGAHVGKGSWMIRAVLPGRMRCRDGTSLVDQFVPVPTKGPGTRTIDGLGKYGDFGIEVA